MNPINEVNLNNSLTNLSLEKKELPPIEKNTDQIAADTFKSLETEKLSKNKKKRLKAKAKKKLEQKQPLTPKMQKENPFSISDKNLNILKEISNKTGLGEFCVYDNLTVYWNDVKNELKRKNVLGSKLSDLMLKQISQVYLRSYLNFFKAIYRENDPSACQNYAYFPEDFEKECKESIGLEVQKQFTTSSLNSLAKLSQKKKSEFLKECEPILSNFQGSIDLLNEISSHKEFITLINKDSLNSIINKETSGTSQEFLKQLQSYASFALDSLKNCYENKIYSLKIDSWEQLIHECLEFAIEMSSPKKQHLDLGRLKDLISRKQDLINYLAKYKDLTHSQSYLAKNNEFTFKEYCQQNNILSYTDKNSDEFADYLLNHTAMTIFYNDTINTVFSLMQLSVSQRFPLSINIDLRTKLFCSLIYMQNNFEKLESRYQFAYEILKKNSEDPFIKNFGLDEVLAKIFEDFKLMWGVISSYRAEDLENIREVSLKSNNLEEWGNLENNFKLLREASNKINHHFQDHSKEVLKIINKKQDWTIDELENIKGLIADINVLFERFLGNYFVVPKYLENYIVEDKDLNISIDKEDLLVDEVLKRDYPKFLNVNLDNRINKLKDIEKLIVEKHLELSSKENLDGEKTLIEKAPAPEITSKPIAIFRDREKVAQETCKAAKPQVTQPSLPKKNRQKISLRDLKIKDVLGAIKQLGYLETRVRGSHHIFTHSLTKKIVPVPIHSGKEIKVGTLKSILEMAEENSKLKK